MLGALRAEPDRSHGNKRASRHLPPDLYRRGAEFVDKISGEGRRRLQSRLVFSTKVTERFRTGQVPISKDGVASKVYASLPRRAAGLKPIGDAMHHRLRLSVPAPSERLHSGLPCCLISVRPRS